MSELPLYPVGTKVWFSGQSKPNGPKIYPATVIKCEYEGLGMGWIYEVLTSGDKPEKSANNYESMFKLREE